MFLEGDILKKKSFFILLCLFLFIGILIFFLFFYGKTAKNLKIGNNTTSQEIVDAILNSSSYETEIQVEVTSNKNQNQYKIKQHYQKPDISEQEVLEPSNLAEVKITKNGNQLKLENTNLSLSSVFENYAYLSSNDLDLNSFIEDYQSDHKANWNEENNQIMMVCHKDQKEKKLWIDKLTAKPTKLEIKDTNKKSNVYILYHEVTIF